VTGVQRILSGSEPFIVRPAAQNILLDDSTYHAINLIRSSCCRTLHRSITRVLRLAFAPRNIRLRARAPTFRLPVVVESRASVCMVSDSHRATHSRVPAFRATSGPAPYLTYQRTPRIVALSFASLASTRPPRPRLLSQHLFHHAYHVEQACLLVYTPLASSLFVGPSIGPSSAYHSSSRTQLASYHCLCPLCRQSSSSHGYTSCQSISYNYYRVTQVFFLRPPLPLLLHPP